MSKGNSSNPGETGHRETLAIACATVIEEMLPLMPPGMRRQTLDFGLHVDPPRLKAALQIAVDAAPPGIGTIILGYGLCAQAVVGLQSGEHTLIVPRIDDCIGIFLGSDAEYRRQQSKTPGTYYLTKGWIESASSPFDDYDRIVKKYGEGKAKRLMDRMLKNYTRLALINTGQEGMDHYRGYARGQAERFGLVYEEVAGSTAMVRKLLFGPYDAEFVVARPGHTISLTDFKKA